MIYRKKKRSGNCPKYNPNETYSKNKYPFYWQVQNYKRLKSALTKSQRISIQIFKRNNNILEDFNLRDYVRDYHEMNLKTYRKLMSDKCVGCNATKNKHLHHITPKSDGGNKEENNLIVLCKDCHENVHGFEIGV